jgi:Flp pilus assembly pilin Flp
MKKQPFPDFCSALRKFLAAREATSAIEFALIVPVLAVIVVTLADVANIAVGVGTMQTGMRSSIQYAMNGGTDMTVAQAQGLQAWNNPPAGANLTAVMACFCGASAAACDVPCADLTAPTAFVTVTAAGTYGGNVITRNETLTEKVRVR